MENINDLLTPRYLEFAHKIIELFEQKDCIEWDLRENSADMDNITYNSCLHDLHTIEVDGQAEVVAWEKWKKERWENNTDS